MDTIPHWFAALWTTYGVVIHALPFDMTGAFTFEHFEAAWVAVMLFMPRRWMRRAFGLRAY